MELRVQRQCRSHPFHVRFGSCVGACILVQCLLSYYVLTTEWVQTTRGVDMAFMQTEIDGYLSKRRP